MSYSYYVAWADGKRNPKFNDKIDGVTLRRKKADAVKDAKKLGLKEHEVAKVRCPKD